MPPSLRSPWLSSNSLSNNLPILVAGPTGVGKSVFAAELAFRLGGEILGADAYQVYAGMEILTAQPELPGVVPHHLIGFLPPTESFDAARFVVLAKDRIAQIQSRGRVALLVGGSGMYLKALTHGLEDAPPPDPVLRAELNALSADALRSRLDSVDPAARSRVDFTNPRRVQRALEICLQTGRPVSGTRRTWETRETPGFRGILLTRDREDLDARIAANVDAMFRRGVLREVAALGDAPPCSALRTDSTASRAIGMREIQAHLRGAISESECRAAIVLATRRYAKRQATWFRNQFSFPVINLSTTESSEALEHALTILGEA